MAFSAEYRYRIQDKYSSVIDKITRKTDKFKMSVASASIALKGMNKKLGKFGKASMALGRDLSTKLTLPIVAVGTAGVVSFARIEKGLINVNNLLARDELLKYRGKLDSLHEGALKAGFSIDDVNTSLFSNISNLGANEKAFEAFGVAQKLAIGGNTQLGVSVKGIGAILNAYSGQNISAIEAANAFFSAQVKGSTDVEQLANSIGNVAPQAKLAGVGFKELLATISTLTLGGISTDESVTALNSALTKLANPTPAVRKKMEDLEVSFGAAQIKAKGLKTVLQEIATAREKHGDDALMQIIPNVRALKAIATLADDGKLEKIDEILLKINSDIKTGDGLMRGYADMSASMTLKWLQAQGRLTVAFREFVILYEPKIKKIIDATGRLIEKFSNLTPATKKIIVVAAALAAILPPLIIGFGAVAFSISSIVALLTSAGFIAVLGGIGAAFALATIPIWIFAIAIGSVSAAIYQLAKNWDALKAPGFLKALGGWVSQVWGGGEIDMGESQIGSGAANNKAESRGKDKSKDGTVEVKVGASEGSFIESAKETLNTGYNFVFGN